MDGGSRCCSLEDVNDARRTCEKLGIAHYVLDARAAFRRHVLEPFHQACAAGQTPSPCVGCNSRVKFGWLMERALELDCELVATGHYARIASAGSRLYLERGLDESKDQSYFLFELSQFQLAHSVFPLGDMDKDEVRARAEAAALLPAAKPESQDLCFLPRGGRAEYLQTNVPELEQPGEIVRRDGRKLGEHRGVSYYTIGQRKGLGLGGGPWYVVELRPAARQIVVGREDEARQSRMRVRDLHWMLPPANGKCSCQARIRHQHQPAPASVTPGAANEAEVAFEEPQFAVTPGQAAVFYDGSRVLGGGWIAN